MAYLKHSFNGSTVGLYELGDQTLLGRHPSANITLDDPTISAEHARVAFNKGTGVWQLIDMDSTNGLMIAGKRVTSACLVAGTVFSLGTHQFEFLASLPQDLGQTLKIKKSWIPGVYYTRPQ